MISSGRVINTASGLIAKCQTRNPFFLAKKLDVEVMIKPLGSLMGFYKDVFGTAFIFLNSSLSHSEATIVCAHELGHHLLHKEAAAYGFEEASVFSPIGRREYEADLFAAALLVSAEDLSELLNEGCSVSEAALRLNTDRRLLDILLNNIIL